MGWFPFVSWVASAVIDVALDPRWKPESTKEQIDAYSRNYFILISALNVGYGVLTRKVVDAGIAQAGYMVGVEDVLYFAIKGQPIPDKVDYLPEHMNTSGKLVTNSTLVLGVAVANLAF